MSENLQPIQRYDKLFLGFLSLLFVGIVYAWSILNRPLRAEFGWEPAQLALCFTITMCFFCVGGILAGNVVKKLKPKLTVIVAGVLVTVGMILTSTNPGSLMMLYLTYGVITGTGVGMAYNLMISCTNAWFPDRRGFSTGTLMMGFGLSAMVLGNVASAMFEMEAIGWRTTFVILGVAIGAVLLLCGFLVRVPTPDVKFPAPKATLKRPPVQAEDLTTPEMIRRAFYWKMYISNSLMTGVGFSVISFAMAFSLEVGAAPAVATMLVGILSIGNALGRIFCGLTYDYFGAKPTLLVAFCLNAGSALLLLVVIMTGSIPLLAIGIITTGIGFGFCPTISGAFTMEYFGKTNFPSNFGISTTLLIPGSMLATVSGIIVQNMNYQAAFIVLFAICIISLIIILSMKRK